LFPNLGAGTASSGWGGGGAAGSAGLPSWGEAGGGGGSGSALGALDAPWGGAGTEAGSSEWPGGAGGGLGGSWGGAPAGAGFASEEWAKPGVAPAIAGAGADFDGGTSVRSFSQFDGSVVDDLPAYEDTPAAPEVVGGWVAAGGGAVCDSEGSEEEFA